MSRPLRALISVSALAGNLARARERAGGARIWAVMKANAYGHGLDAAARGFTSADGWALLEWDWAESLRRADPQRRILMLEGAFTAADAKAAAQLGLDLVVHEPRQIEWLERLDPAQGRVNVMLKFESGMNRLGFGDEEVRPAYERLLACGAVAGVGLMTHFANADIPGGTDEPQRRFHRATEGLPGPRSTCNSAALHAFPARGDDWVRPGIMLYGASPFAGRSAASLGLSPAMRLESAVIATRRIAAGETIGYGSTFRARRAMRVGVVACGYADGYPRHAPDGTPVVVDGVRTRLVGRVSMDMITVDLDPVPAATPGSPVALWGDSPSVDEVAEHAGTIGYELLCAVSRRVPLVVDQPAVDSSPGVR